MQKEPNWHFSYLWSVLPCAEFIRFVTFQDSLPPAQQHALNIFQAFILHKLYTALRYVSCGVKIKNMKNMCFWFKHKIIQPINYVTLLKNKVNCALKALNIQKIPENLQVTMLTDPENVKVHKISQALAVLALI